MDDVYFFFFFQLFCVVCRSLSQYKGMRSNIYTYKKSHTHTIFLFTRCRRRLYIFLFLSFLLLFGLSLLPSLSPLYLLSFFFFLLVVFVAIENEAI